MVRSLILVLALCFATVATADEPQKIRFYFACTSCEFDFVRTQLTYVDYVRDPADADVHGYVVEEEAANGGTRYTFTFLGRKRFEGVSDTLQFTEKHSDTQDDFRAQVMRTLGLGLARYVSHSGEGHRLTVEYAASDTNAGQVNDPWDSWVFSADVNAYLSGEQSHAYYNYWGSLNANRITPDWKMRFSVDNSYLENRFYDLEIKSIGRSSSISSLLVKSLSNHFSAGPSLTVSSATYSNKRLATNGGAALEYDIFPYSESTTHQMRILYKVGFADYHYNDTTIYNKMHDLFATHSVSLATVYAKPWGSLELTVYGQQFLQDISMNELSIYGNVSWRVLEGLSLHVSGDYSIVHDQISLVKGTLSDDEIILQRHQQATNYTFNTVFGLSYTFGSIFNNVVNPRFGN